MSKASFSADGEYIVATGLRNKLFYIYDMMEGRVIPVSSVRGEIWSLRRALSLHSLVSAFANFSFFLLPEVIELIYTELVLECNVFCVWMFL